MPTGNDGEDTSAPQESETSVTTRAHAGVAQPVGNPIAPGPQVSPSCWQQTALATRKAAESWFSCFGLIVIAVDVAGEERAARRGGGGEGGDGYHQQGNTEGQ